MELKKLTIEQIAETSESLADQLSRHGIREMGYDGESMQFLSDDDAETYWAGEFGDHVAGYWERCGRPPMEAFADINNERVWNTIETRWNTTKWGVNIRSTDTISTALAGLSNTLRQRVIGVLEEAALGILDLTDRGNKRSCNLIRELGLVPGIDTISSGEAIGFVDIHRGEVTTS